MPINACDQCNNKFCAKCIPMFSELSEEQMAYVIELIDRKVYNKGDFLVREGEWVDHLTILSIGKAKGYRYNAEGKEQILHIYGSGDFFGEKSLLHGRKGNFAIEALEGVHACSIHKDDFADLVAKYPYIGLKVMEALAQRLERLEQSVEVLGIGTAEDKVIGVIAEFKNKFGMATKEGTIITLPVSREGVANYIGLTRESVSKTLSQLQEDGYIEMMGNKKILLKKLPESIK